MTANQIAYAKHVEERRHNRVSETHEHLQAETSAKRQAEDARHNRATEAHNWWATSQTLGETQRHNQESEAISWWTNRATLDESQRHNLATEGTARYSAEQTALFQRGQLQAQQRQAAVAERNASVNELNAQTRSNELAASIAAVRSQVGLGYAQLKEQAIHNRNVESEAQTNNWLRRVEDQRHNIATENVAQQEADVAARNATANERNAASTASQATSARITAISRAVDTGIRGATTLAGSIRRLLG